MDRRWQRRHASREPLGTPSPFVIDALEVLARTRPSLATRQALDVACGRGRHALLLAERGYAVDAVDFAWPALAFLKRESDLRGLAVRCLAADVTAWPLPRARYAVVTVVNFLDRSLFAALRAAVAPGGALLCETYRRDDMSGTSHALRPEFLLAPGELDQVCGDWRILLRHEDTTMHDGKPVTRAGILAQRPLDTH